MGRTRSGSAASGPRRGLFASPTRELARSDGPAAVPTPMSTSSGANVNGGQHNSRDTMAAGALQTNTKSAQAQLPSIRFIAHQDPRAARPSLDFTPISRTLPSESTVIRVGRYSEKDLLQEQGLNAPSAAPVGFKSKVVSRRHCEFWCSDGQWYIKDVKSSSGTFLNHIRLSSASVESRPFPVNDGDIVQLGIDFKGGEEMIFRCVKIRIECNRGWQKSLNQFNTTTHRRLRNLSAMSGPKDSDAASTHSSDCAICLFTIAPCQALFVAPCSHVWHYKCIRPILHGPTWPQFLCPNCRAVTDLEADVEDVVGDWEEEKPAPQTNGEHVEAAPVQEASPRKLTPPSDTEDHSENLDFHDARQPGVAGVTSESNGLSTGLAASSSAPIDSPGGPGGPSGIPIGRRVRQASGPSQETASQTFIHQPRARLADISAPPSSSAERLGVEGPMTPRNDAGPFVFDGSGSRRPGMAAITNLDEAASSPEDPMVNGEHIVLGSLD